MFNTIGIPGLLILLGIVLVIFGPKRLPALGRSLGSGLREFKDSISRKSSSDEDEAARLDSPSVAPASKPGPEAATTRVADGESAGDPRS